MRWTMSDYAALRAAAEAATPGPWAVATWGPVLTKAWVDYDADPNAPTPELWLCIAGQSPEDSAYIAAANPSVALALLDRLNAAEAERDRLAAALARAEQAPLIEALREALRVATFESHLEHSRHFPEADR